MLSPDSLAVDDIHWQNFLVEPYYMTEGSSLEVLDHAAQVFTALKHFKVVDVHWHSAPDERLLNPMSKLFAAAQALETLTLIQGGHHRSVPHVLDRTQMVRLPMQLALKFPTVMKLRATGFLLDFGDICGCLRQHPSLESFEIEESHFSGVSEGTRPDSVTECGEDADKAMDALFKEYTGYEGVRAKRCLVRAWAPAALDLTDEEAMRSRCKCKWENFED